jgi:hypothetical protein
MGLSVGGVMISQSRRLGVEVSEMTPHQSPIRIKAPADRVDRRGP